MFDITLFTSIGKNGRDREKGICHGSNFALKSYFNNLANTWRTSLSNIHHGTRCQNMTFKYKVSTWQQINYNKIPCDGGLLQGPGLEKGRPHLSGGEEPGIVVVVGGRGCRGEHRVPHSQRLLKASCLVTQQSCWQHHGGGCCCWGCPVSEMSQRGNCSFWS